MAVNIERSAASMLRQCDSQSLSLALNNIVRGNHGAAVQIRRGDIIVSASNKVLSEDGAIEVGCVAKTLTAMLLGVAISSGRISWNSRLESHLPIDLSSGSVIRSHLANVTILQLLTHTHGLDHASLDFGVYTKSDGVDAPKLLASLSKENIFAAPGKTFCYGTIGSWLASCILERIFSLPLKDALDAYVFQPLGITLRTSAGSLCPAMGGSLLLSARDLGTITSAFHISLATAQSLNSAAAELMSIPFFPLPKRPHLGENIGAGIIDFGHGWFGHSGQGTSTSSSLAWRILPSESISITVAATHAQLADRILAMLYGREFQQLAIQRLPKQLLPTAAESLDMGAYTGTYHNSRFTLKVILGEGNRLKAQIFPRNQASSEAAIREGTLIAAEECCMLPTIPVNNFPPLFCFLEPTTDGKFSVVRTPAMIYRRQLH